jgi:hypothetical protein
MEKEDYVDISNKRENYLEVGLRKRGQMFIE